MDARIDLGRIKKRRIAHEEFRRFLNKTCWNRKRAEAVGVVFSADEAWVKPLSIAREGATELARPGAEEAPGRSPGNYPGRNPGLARWWVMVRSFKRLEEQIENIAGNQI